MKTCNNCKKIKTLSEFNKDKSKRDGLQTFCRECKQTKDKTYAEKNREAARKRAKDWRKNNLQKAKESCKKWRNENPEKMAAYKKKWSKENKARKNKLASEWKKKNSHKVLANTRSRQALKLNATPAWADKVAIDYIYYAAKVIERVYGTKWHVDHIIPLKGKNVCGLHVQNNLQLLAPLDNLKKSNKLGG